MLPSDHGGDIAFHTTCPSASSSLLGAMLKSSGESEESRGEPSGRSAASRSRAGTRIAGRGIVYPVANRARDCCSQRIVARKFIGSAEARYQERFVAEARILRRLSHPAGRPPECMEHVSGRPQLRARAIVRCAGQRACRSDAPLRTAIAAVGIRELAGLRGRDASLRLPAPIATWPNCIYAQVKPAKVILI